MRKTLILSSLAVIVATVAVQGASIDELAWMAGSWHTQDPSGMTEELWTEPAGGLMLGLNRSVPRQGKTSFEFLRIEERDGAVVYLASPGGAEPTAFTLTKATSDRAVFENPEHDFPQRIIYRTERGSLCARAETLAGKGEEWCWSRKKE